MNAEDIVFMGPTSSTHVSETEVVDWEGLMAKVKGPCSGCPRNGSKAPVVFNRKSSLGNVEFMVISQERDSGLGAFRRRQRKTSFGYARLVDRISQRSKNRRTRSRRYCRYSATSTLWEVRYTGPCIEMHPDKERPGCQ